MPQCIYTGANEFSESFNTAEHVFPKCIGGVHTLPKGWVCDRVNNSFSKMELCFARRNPTVSITRMFIPETGRKNIRIEITFVFLLTPQIQMIIR